MNRDPTNQEKRMNRLLLSFFVFVALISLPFVVSSKELIREFNGSESKVTADFEVKGPWIADWRTKGDYPGQMAVDIGLVDAATGEFIGKIVTTKYIGNGVRLFKESGVYRFHINSSLARWTVRVEQLTRQEAETYIPKEKL